MLRKQDTDPYRFLGFWELGIISTLMVAFFPWSLLFCVVFYGLEETKLLIVALLHDWFITVLATLAVVIPLVIAIIAVILVLAV